jgi:mannan endo-1,4-beta-mannosidase
VYNNASIINSYMSSFKSNGLALVVGEFAADHFGENVDEGSIMSYAKQYNYGYIGWSWAGNGSGLTSLDIAQNFNPSTLSSWGNTLINSANGIKATSKKATIFGGGSSSSAASGGTCNWYGTSYPICVNTSSGWGWENNKSCIARSTCSSQ